MTIDKGMFFRIEIDGFASAEFMTCSELTVELGELSIRQGGTLVADKDPGLATYPDIVMTRGKTLDRDFYNWMKLLIDGASGRGTAPSTELKKDFDIVQLDRNGDEVKRYRVFKAWPKIRTIGPWDNDAEEYVIESLTLACKYWDEL